MPFITKYGNKCDRIAGLFCFILGIVVPSSLSLIFAVLLYESYDNTDFNDDCQDEKLIQGAFAASIILLVSVGLTSIRAIITICHNYSDNEQSKSSKICQGILDFFIVLSHLVCSVGLTVVSNEQCGQLNDVAISYYIVGYVGLVLFLFYFLFKIFSTIFVTYFLCQCLNHCCKSCDRNSHPNNTSYPHLPK